ncbi:MAG: S41 family peptidase, partial [Bacteroidales bacterium]|uniref:S41 family peptidase n=1 Tax=Porphyromonas sp. TaxID=1924944 RepID=UPI00297982EA
QKLVAKCDINVAGGQVIHRGDVVVAINHQPIENFISCQRRYISASTPQAEIKEILRHGFPVLDKDSIVVYTFKGQGPETRDYAHKSATRDYSNFSMPVRSIIKQNQMIQEIIPNVYYVDISPRVFKLKKFVDFVKEATQAKAYIIDLRKYPAPEAYLLLGMLSETPVSWGDYRIPVRYLPHQQSVVWEAEIENIAPNKQQITAPCYFLIDSCTNSYGESMAVAVKKNHLGTLVGSNTSGTNGNMGEADLKMFNFTFSVGKDFEGFHGKGVAPDVLVYQKREDFLVGKDSAIESILSNY